MYLIYISLVEAALSSNYYVDANAMKINWHLNWHKKKTTLLKGSNHIVSTEKTPPKSTALAFNSNL